MNIMNAANNLKFFLKRNIKILVASSLLNLLIISGLLFITGAYVYFHRAAIFNSFASRYLAETLARPDEKTQEKERKNVLSEETMVVGAVEKASPAVVSIVVTKDVPIIEQYFEQGSPFDNPFGDFFGPFEFRVPRYREKGTEKKEIGGGSGFLVSSDGLVVTNKHVVSDSEASYTALTNDGKKFEAKVIAKDSFFDIAILRINGGNFPYLNFGNSDILKPGQTTIAIGNALGEFRNSVSVGVISGLSRSLVAGDAQGKSEFLEEVIQTDAAINPGNSGGPLLDLNGKVIGVNVAMVRGSENIGFALPANIVKSIVNSVQKTGEIARPFLGIRYIQINDELKRRNNLSVDYGILIARGETQNDLPVIPGSPADKAGLVENDIILEIDGAKLDGARSFASIIRKKSVSETVRLKILHKGETKDIPVTLEKAPKES